MKLKIRYLIVLIYSLLQVKLGNWAALGLGVSLVSPVQQVRWVQVDQLVLMDSQDHGVNLERMDHLGLQETMAFQVLVDQGVNLGHRVPRAHLGHLGPLVRLDPLDHKVHEVSLVLRDSPGSLAPRDHLGPRDHVDRPVNKVFWEELDLQAPVGSVVITGLVDLGVREDQWDLLASQANQDLLDRSDHQDHQDQVAQQDL